jgi:HlyD family secretion protein
MPRSILNHIKGWKLPALALGGIVFALVTIFSRQPAPAQDPIIPPPQSTYAQTIAGIGVVEPQSETISIGSDLSGLVLSVPVQVGQSVKQGDILFQLDGRSAKANIVVLETALASAQIAAKDAEVQFQIVRNINSQAAISKEDFSRRQYAVELAKAKIVETEALLSQAKVNLDRLTITSPIDATILSVDVRPGEFVGPSLSSPPFIRLGNTDSLHVLVEIDEENSSKVSNNSAAKAYQRGDTKSPIELEFIRIEPYVRSKQNLAVAGQRVDTRVLQIIYRVKQFSQKLYVGEQVDVFIEDKS